MIIAVIIVALAGTTFFAAAMYVQATLRANALEAMNDKFWCLAEAVAELGELKAEAYGTVTPHGDGVDEEIRITPETFDAIRAVIQDARKLTTPSPVTLNVVWHVGKGSGER